MSGSRIVDGAHRGRRAAHEPSHPVLSVPEPLELTVAMTLPAILGGLTAAYAAAVIVRPKVLAGPCDLTGPGGGLSTGVATLSRSVGARDLASGLAMVLAPTATATRVAIAVRVASDLSDALVLGSTLPTASARRKAAAVGVLWGALCAASALTLE